MKQLSYLFYVTAFAAFTITSRAQNVGVNNDGTSPETNVMLDVKGSNAAATTGLQNIFQIKSNNASTDALKLRLGLGTNSTATSRYGVIDVPDYVGNSVSAYRPLALQPLGGNVGIGTTTPVAELEVIGLQTSLPRDIVLSHYFTGALSDAQIWLRRARGIPSAPVALLSGDEIGFVKFRGYDGSTFSSNDQTEIGAIATENFSATANGSALKFMTTPNGTVAGLERMRIDENGFVGMGTSTPQTNLEVNAFDQKTAIQIVNTGGTAPRNPRLNIYNFNAFGGTPVIQFHNARGTYAAPGASLLGDGMGNIDFGGYDGTALYDAAQISGIATEAPTATAHGGAIMFSTVGNGTINPVEKMRLDNTGFLGIGTTTPEAKLHVVNETSTSPRGIISHQSSNDGNSAFIQLRKSRGTFLAPAVVQTTDVLGTILSEAYDGSGSYIRSGSNIKFIVNGTVAAGSVPTDIVFQTGSSGLGTERLRITSTGNIITSTALPVYANNAAALAGGLAVGTLYRTGGDPDVVCVVH